MFELGRPQSGRGGNVTGMVLDTTNPPGAAGSGIGTVFWLALSVLTLAATWRVFTKAGQHGWAALIPIYNLVILARVVGRSGWWAVLMLIPILNLIFLLIIYVDLAKSFGRTGGFGCGLVLLPFVFLPILAFGDAQYRGPWARLKAQPQGYAPYGGAPQPGAGGQWQPGPLPGYGPQQHPSGVPQRNPNDPPPPPPPPPPGQ